MRSLDTCLEKYGTRKNGLKANEMNERYSNIEKEEAAILYLTHRLEIMHVAIIFYEDISNDHQVMACTCLVLTKMAYKLIKET